MKPKTNRREAGGIRRYLRQKGKTMGKKVRMDRMAKIIKGMENPYIALYKGAEGIYGKLLQGGKEKGYEVHWTKETPELVVTKVIEELTDLRRAERGAEDDPKLIAVFM